MIDFTQPNTTLDWAAAHKFDPLFNAKYCSGKLTMSEYLELIEVSISHVKSFHNRNSIEWYRFRARYQRRLRLKELDKLRLIIYHAQWRNNVYKKAKPWGGDPLNTSKNAYL